MAELVTITNDSLPGDETAVVSRAAFDRVYAAKGWRVIGAAPAPTTDSDTDASAEAPAPAEAPDTEASAPATKTGRRTASS